MKPKLIVMCGLQCSGKSTLANKLSAKYNATVLSSDTYRLWYPDADNNSIFKMLYEYMNKYLTNNHNVILDATNVTIKSRKHIFDNLKVDCEKICYIVNTKYSTCLSRLKKRNNSDYPSKVPEEVLKKYYYSFEVPFYNEGWDEILIHKKPSDKSRQTWVDKIFKKAETFDQHNKHHSKLLGPHMDDVANKIIQNADPNTTDLNLFMGAYFHDIGKLFTQTYKPNDPNAHYYNHANVGAYEFLSHTGIYVKDLNKDTFIYHLDKTLRVAFYINYHMHLQNIKTEKAINKWTKIFGNYLYNNLVIFDRYDKGGFLNEH